MRGNRHLRRRQTGSAYVRSTMYDLDYSARCAERRRSRGGRYDFGRVLMIISANKDIFSVD